MPCRAVSRAPSVHPYATRQYAATLSHIGRPLYVDAWDTHVIVRSWQAGVEDAMGTYPLACLAEDSNLAAGLDALRSAGLLTVTLVVDGLAGPALVDLRKAFGHIRPFKTHFVVDPAIAPYAPSSHHQYEIRRALRRGVEVREHALRDIIDDWTALYENLIERHAIAGVQRFSRASFEALAACDGVCALAAWLDGDLVSCHLWVRHGQRVWSHLAASSEAGYAAGAAYAIYDGSIRRFEGELVSLGGSAGLAADGDGLARFKAGFSNRTIEAHVVGEVLDPGRYEIVCAQRGGASAGDYFPLYRSPQAPGATA